MAELGLRQNIISIYLLNLILGYLTTVIVVILFIFSEEEAAQRSLTDQEYVPSNITGGITE